MDLKNKYIYLLSILLIYSSFSLFANDYFELKLTMEEPAFGQFFGGTISTDGLNMAISGGYALHYFRHIDNEWIKIQSITTDDIPYSLPIINVCMHNGNIIYSSGVSPVLPEESNRIYIASYNNIWVQDTVITIEDIDDPDLLQFGNRVLFYNNKILVMAKTETTSRVYLFEKNDAIWEISQYFEKDISELFGFLLTMNDEHICVGAAGFFEDYENSGAVYCSHHDGSDWNELARITSPEPDENYRFGGEVQLFDDQLFIGEYGNIYTTDFPGKVHIYQFDGTNWEYQYALSSSDSEGGDRFGSHIDGHGDKLVIGALNNDDAGNGSGSAYIFEKIAGTDGEMIWVEQKKIISSDLNVGDGFGEAVGINNDFVMIGASNHNNMSGAVYIYDPHDTTLHANFAGDVRNGNAPLTVQFTSVPQGNPTSYEWDFNSDGYVDSTEPHPEFTYQINGIYDVTLTIYDETGSDADIKTEYIQVVSDILFGDVDNNGILDVLDLMLYVNFILGNMEPAEDQYLAGDVNYSGQIDIMDIILVINEILD